MGGSNIINNYSLNIQGRILISMQSQCANETLIKSHLSWPLLFSLVLRGRHLTTTLTHSDLLDFDFTKKKTKQEIRKYKSMDKKCD